MLLTLASGPQYFLFFFHSNKILDVVMSTQLTAGLKNKDDLRTVSVFLDNAIGPVVPVLRCHCAIHHSLIFVLQTLKG